MSFFTEIGRYIIFMSFVFKRPDRRKVFYKMLMREMNLIGIDSLLVVVLIAIITGAVTTVQTASQLTADTGFLPPNLFPLELVGSVVGSSSILELAPTITCLILAGKVGASIASEVGNMRITEQIDAYEVLGINSVGFITLPKILAGIIVIPCLIIISNFLLIFGGLLAAKLTGVMTLEQYINGLRSSFVSHYVEVMLIKAFVFAFIITSLSAFQGYYTKGGALEVGEAGTKAVTRICVTILAFDLIIAKLFL
ncbi:MAG: ABC transporter permease [Flavobacteriales bacterium]|nr:MAG: ABC transporter permease [Flavobacteriales bacterium]